MILERASYNESLSKFCCRNRCVLRGNIYQSNSHAQSVTIEKNFLSLRNVRIDRINIQDFTELLEISRGRRKGVLFQRFAREDEIPGHDPGDVDVCNGAVPCRCVQQGVHVPHTHTLARCTHRQLAPMPVHTATLWPRSVGLRSIAGASEESSQPAALSFSVSSNRTQLRFPRVHRATTTIIVNDKSTVPPSSLPPPFPSPCPSTAPLTFPNRPPSGKYRKLKVPGRRERESSTPPSRRVLESDKAGAGDASLSPSSDRDILSCFFFVSLVYIFSCCSRPFFGRWKLVPLHLLNFNIR